METQTGSRKRLMGYLGVAVTTLLTPGGKLFSSALAAATIVGVAGVAMLSDKNDESNAKPSTPAIAQTGAMLTGDELLGLTDLPAMESGFDPLTASTSVPATNVSAPSAASIQASQSTPSMRPIHVAPTPVPLSNGVPVIVIGDGMPQTSRPIEPSAIPKLPTPETLAVLPAIPEDENSFPPKVQDQGNEEPKDPIVSEAPDARPILDDPEVLALPKKNGLTDPNNTGDAPLFTADAGFPSQAILPLLSHTQLPAPSTLGLFLLGLANFGWLYRRRARC